MVGAERVRCEKGKDVVLCKMGRLQTCEILGASVAPGHYFYDLIR